MRPLEIVRSALHGVTGNKLRSVLTLLGVLIGVAAVILLLAVGNGSAQTVQNAISSLGTTTLTVRGSFTSDQVTAVERAGLGHVTSVVPQVSTSLTVSSASDSASNVSVVGTTPGYFDSGTSGVSTGDAFTTADVTTAAKVAVIGQSLATSLFPTGSALGQSISIDGNAYTVVGILESQSSTGPFDSNSIVIAPITRVQRSFTGFGTISTMTVQATDADSVSAAEAELTIVLNQLQGTTTDTESFSITNQSSLLETQAASADSFTVLLGVVAAISLLVGGIGVTNVMLVTVTERTREIGIRKALGATRGAILGQFLAEAATLTLVGGVLGVVVALIGAQYEIYGTQPVVLDYSIPLALGVSVAIGVFFGVYPAARAATMRPIQALRSI